MRPNKQTSLRQRLHRGDPTDFTALLQGVSTLVEEAAAEAAPEVQEPAPAAVEPATPEVATDIGAPATAEALPARPVPPRAPAPSVPNPVLLDVPADPVPQAGPGGRAASPILPPVSKASSREDRLHGALERLACQLAVESGRMAVALRDRDTEEAGFRLAHVNQVLDLLRSIDASGDLSRQLGVPYAPPEGRSWPGTAWTVVEFAESPFSGLLAEGAGEAFIREMLYAAWGVGLEPAIG